MPNTLEPATIPPRSNGKHPGGRPSKRTPTLVAKLAQAIADGLPDEYACALVGVRRETLHAWRTDPEFAQFSNAIKAVQGERMRKRLARVDAGEPGWQGTAWILERCYAREFCRPEIQFNQQINLQQINAGEQPVHMIPQAEMLEMLRIVAQVDAEIEGESPSAEMRKKISEGLLRYNKEKTFAVCQPA
jgi:hypothetical protein